MSSDDKKARTLKKPKVWPADKPLTGLKASIEEADFGRLIPKQIKARQEPCSALEYF